MLEFTSGRLIFSTEPSPFPFSISDKQTANYKYPINIFTCSTFYPEIHVYCVQRKTYSRCQCLVFSQSSEEMPTKYNNVLVKYNKAPLYVTRIRKFPIRSSADICCCTSLENLTVGFSNSEYVLLTM